MLQEQNTASAAAPAGWPPAGTIELGPGGYARLDERGVNGWLRRNSGVLGLLGVLLMCLLVGLLVGHWVSQGNTVPAKQVLEVKGLAGISGAAPGNTTTNAAAASEAPAASKTSAKEEAEESKEAAKETKAEKAPPPAPVKVTPAKLKKLSKTTGKKHAEEVNALGAQPIETG